MAEGTDIPKSRWSWQRFGGKFLVISILAHVLFLGGATYFVVQRYQAKRKLTFQAGPPSPNPATQVVEHKVQMHKETTMSAPQMVKRITTTGLGKVSLPEMPEMPTEPQDVQPMKMTGQTQTLGMPAMMLGGANSPGGGIALPSIMADRCSPEGRAKSIDENGGDTRTDQAVVNALRWLKQNQNPDGSWGGHFQPTGDVNLPSAGTFATEAEAKAAFFANKIKVTDVVVIGGNRSRFAPGFKGAMTGFATLAFLGHCERPSSPEFGPTIKNAIDWLVADKPEMNSYIHAIEAYALGEAYILAHDERIVPVLQASIAVILKGQRPDGGFDYNYALNGKGSDTSVTCWQVQALKTAHYTGIKIDGVDESLEKAMTFLEGMQGENGIIGYRAKGLGGNLTGAGVFCLLAWHHGKDQTVRDGLKVLKNGPIPAGRSKPGPAIKYDFADKTANLYAWYYDTQACFQAGGSHWAWWNHILKKEVLDNQQPDGTWPSPGGADPTKFAYTGTGADLDAITYRTCLCTLMMEVYYRYLSTSKADGALGD